MDEIGKNLFYSLLAEFFVVVFAIFVKDDKRKVVIVLALGTLLAGAIGFGRNIVETMQGPFYSDPISEQQTPIPLITPSTDSELNLRLVFYGYPEQGVPQTGTATISNDGLQDIQNIDYLRTGGELSPDGKLIAFDNCSEPNRGFYISKHDGSDLRKEIRLSTDYCIHVRWSPDGSKLSFEGPDGYLHVFDFASGKDTKVRGTYGADWQWWSPSGNEIVYGKGTIWGNLRKVFRLLYITDLQGNNRQLTSEKDFTACERDGNSVDVWDPAWSPDGQTIAFTQCGSLFTISPTGINLRQLTVSPYATSSWPNAKSTSAYSPRWSPDGHWIIFIGDNDILMRISVDGTTLIEIGQLPYTGGPFSIAPFVP